MWSIDWKWKLVCNYIMGRIVLYLWQCCCWEALLFSTIINCKFHFKVVILQLVSHKLAWSTFAIKHWYRECHVGEGVVQTSISNFETIYTCGNILYLLYSHLSFFWSFFKK
jgi:hypothetical protein